MKPEKIREGLYIRKDKFGYKIIYPYKNDDGTINWFNVLTGGTWWKLVKVVVIVFLILGMSWGYYHDTKTCRELMSDPCNLLPNISRYCQDLWIESPAFIYNTTLKGGLQNG